MQFELLKASLMKSYLNIYYLSIVRNITAVLFNTYQYTRIHMPHRYPSVATMKMNTKKDSNFIVNSRKNRMVVKWKCCLLQYSGLFRSLNISFSLQMFMYFSNMKFSPFVSQTETPNSLLYSLELNFQNLSLFRVNSPLH
jgi:hypothetical protein